MRGNGEKKKELATHVLQLLFLGFGGFRFPIAHFPCTQATATDLHVILWSAVEMLSAYGFHVLYVNMDGAITIRQMLHIQFPISSPSHQSFLAANPIPNQNKIAFIMDYSHVIKKIRNSLLNSTANGTRLIEDSAGNEIIWDFWVEAFNHSDSTPLHLHRKLTRQHIFPESDDMLQLMYDLRLTLGQDGRKLDATIDLLQQTSVLVAIFRDVRPIIDLSDHRLLKLRDVMRWFNQWEGAIFAKYNTPGQRNRRLMSAETRLDLDSCVTGFCAMVKIRQSMTPGGGVVPARMNSDVIENIFCQQRGKTRTDALTHERTNARTHERTHARTHTRTHAHRQACKHAITRTHAHTHASWYYYYCPCCGPVTFIIIEEIIILCMYFVY